MNAEVFQSVRITKHSRFIKLVLDRFVAAIALIFLSPILLTVALAIYFRMNRPLLFTQVRAGKDSHIFTVYKFRTMTDARDCDGNLLPDEKRVTALGQFLRRAKLDEILQLWNILKGDMSFVGPRPTLPEQVQHYDDFQRCRLLVRPGLTGWAQVNGNTELSWSERICLDLWYLNHWSLWLDFVILIKTFAVVLWGERRNEQALHKALTYKNYSGSVAFLTTYPQKGKLELDTQALGTVIMTPEDTQKLQYHIRGIAEILYKNTDKTDLLSLEAIEKSVRRQMLEMVVEN